MDRHWHLTMRVLKTLAVVGALVIGLWAAGVQPQRWWERLMSLASNDASKAVAQPRSDMPLTTPTAPKSEGQSKPLLPGLDSSVSRKLQRLYLVSVAPSRNHTQGTARLGISRENPQTYVAGALLVNGARLTEIYQDHVVLERDGRRAKLYLVDRDKRIESPLLAVGGEPVSRKPVLADHTEVLAQYLRPSPVYEGDTLKGYKVYAGPRSGVFSQMGLRGGDVIVALNGQPFGDPQQAIEVLKQLTAGASMAATIERDGKLERVDLDGSVILADQQQAAPNSGLLSSGL